jgi:phosphoribosyl 1,2-cyclic phosphodiesterase
MRLVPLGSGSRGNATLVEMGATRLLVDSGLSCRQLALRLEQIGVEPATVDWIVLSHEHEDHVRGAELLSRTHGVPVLSSMQTLEAMDRSPVHFADWQPFVPRPFDLGDVRVELFPVPHDAVAPVGFVLRGAGLRIGFATDLGHVTDVVRDRLRGCHVQMIESNHDEVMLREGAYPWSLKDRIAGRQGHLSNREAAEGLAETVDGECRAVVLLHLSEHNNAPALAVETVARALKRDRGRQVEIHVASAHRPTPALEF